MTEEKVRLQAENIDLRRMLAKAGIDAAERKTVERLQSVIVEELHHRMKNMLAIVLAISTQTLRTAESVQAGRIAIENRLVALGRVHDLLLETDWRAARLSMILATATQPFDQSGAGKFLIQSSESRWVPPPRCH